ncbi:hypothetical protein EDD37DRAFT_217431 [Exophiala viscosa]|uniref:uncharacterized protein n=1 Tax=Exophiala viscosa TaxID=2486360 RepID=UPI00219C24D9|nr:hypothetical protein EDD37DRAFT_217431 [Exophiala viscosa]
MPLAASKRWPRGHGKDNDTEPLREVLIKTWVASFFNIGPLAMPGYGGSRLCVDCGPDESGSRSQTFNVTECWMTPLRNISCSEYMEIWISRPGPFKTSSLTAVVSTTSYVASQGTYTFFFTQEAPDITVVAPASTVTVHLPDGETSQLVEAARTITIPGTPWTAGVVRACQGPTLFDIVTTVTTTATWVPPCETGTSTSGQNGGWYFPNPPSPTVTTVNPASTSTRSPTTYPQSTSTTLSTLGPESLPTTSRTSQPESSITARSTKVAPTSQTPSTSNLGPTSITTSTSHAQSSATKPGPISSSGLPSSSTSTVTSNVSPDPASSQYPSSARSISTSTTQSGATSSSTGVSSYLSTTSVLSTHISSTGISSYLSTTSVVSTNDSTYSSSTTTTSPSTSTVTSSSSPVPTDNFYILVMATSGNIKRASRYLAFVNGYSVVLDRQETAALFALDTEGLLQTNKQFIGAEADIAGTVLKSFSSSVVASETWTLSGDGTLSLTGASGFCETTDGQIAITTAGSSLSDCSLISLIYQGHPPRRLPPLPVAQPPLPYPRASVEAQPPRV